MTEKIREIIDSLQLNQYSITFEKKESCCVAKERNDVTITYRETFQIFPALNVLACYRERERFVILLNACLDLSFMVDLSRNAALQISSLKKLIRRLALLGYERIILYMEDMFEIGYDEYFGHMRGRYSKEELREIVAYAGEFGMEVMPCVETLAHLNQYFKWRGSFPLIDCDDILLCGSEETYRFLESMIDSLCDVFCCSKIMLGMDEAHLLGAGKYFNQHGFVPKREIFLKHLERVAKIIEGKGKTGLIWSDSLFEYMGIAYFQGDEDKQIDPDIAARIPGNIELIHWSYGQDKTETYEKKLLQHRQLNRPVHFAGSTVGSSTISTFNDLAMRYLNCSMQACKNIGLRSYNLYHWGDDGAELSVFATVPSMCLCSAFSYQLDFETLFYHTTGIQFNEYMILDEVNRPYGNKMKYDDNCAEYFKNISKYLLYNDILLGLLDANIEEDYGRNYQETAQKLQAVDAGEYQYLFDTQIALCKVLGNKAAAGIELKRLYDAKDVAGLTAFLRKLDTIRKDLVNFKKMYEKQWETENKPFGLEVFHQRIGGLLLRIDYCENKIKQYIEKKIDRIAELEEKRLTFDKNYNGEQCEIPFATFLNIVTANKM